MPANQPVSGGTARPRLLASVMIAPAAAAPPDGFEVPFTILFPDLENELVVFVNTDRAAYCTPEVVQWGNDVIAWLEGGQVGERRRIRFSPTGLMASLFRRRKPAKAPLLRLSRAPI